MIKRKKLTFDQRVEICEMWVAGYKVSEIAQHFDRDLSCIHRILGKTADRADQIKKTVDYIYDENQRTKRILANTEEILKILTSLVKNK